MPLFPRIPAPVDGDGTTRKAGGAGYQWVVDKFVQMAKDIQELRENSTRDMDVSEYRRLGAIAKELDNPSPEGASPAITLVLGEPVRPGSVMELERLVVNMNAVAAAMTVLVLSDPVRNMMSVIDMSPGNVNTTSAKGFVREYQNKIVLREGMQLVVRLLAAEAAELPVTATAFVRVYPEAPAGLSIS